MGKSAPSPPPPPDPKETAAAQTATNVSTALANAWMGNANEQNPYGNVNYTVNGYHDVTDPNNGAVYQVPSFDRTVTLSPIEQQKLNQQNQIALGLNNLALNQTNKINDLLSTPLSFDNLMPARVNSINAPGNDFSQAAKDTQAAILARMQPEMDRERAQLESTLVNQGFQRGSEGFNQQMDQFGRQQNDANMQAVLAGYQQQQNLFNEQAQAGQFQNTARQQAMQEALAQRNQPINEISALMSGGQVTTPQFSPYQFQPMSPAPVGQYTYQSAALANQNYQSQLAQYNAGLSGMFGLGSSLLGGLFMMSDRRLKKNVRELGIRLKNGAKLYAYEYLGEAAKRVGVMADEIEHVVPAAIRHVDGFKAVDYAQVWGR